MKDSDKNFTKYDFILFITGLLVQMKFEEGRVVDFWIVGRLFGTRELFVCYDSSIPQNMVEIAFRIGLNCIG